jgi:hypothetical protein
MHMRIFLDFKIIIIIIIIIILKPKLHNAHAYFLGF